MWGLGRRPGRGTLQRGDVSFCLQNLLLRAVESVSLLLDSAVLAERGQSPSPAAASPEPQPSPFLTELKQREVRDCEWRRPRSVASASDDFGDDHRIGCGARGYGVHGNRMVDLDLFIMFMPHASWQRSLALACLLVLARILAALACSLALARILAALVCSLALAGSHDHDNMVFNCD